MLKYYVQNPVCYLSSDYTSNGLVMPIVPKRYMWSAPLVLNGTGQSPAVPMLEADLNLPSFLCPSRQFSSTLWISCRT